MRNRKTIAEIMADGKLVDAALVRAAREALVRHLQAGQPVVAWEDGKTVWLGPDEIKERIKAIDRELEQFETARHRAAGRVPSETAPPPARGRRR